MLKEEINELKSNYDVTSKEIKRYLHLLLSQPEVQLGDLEELSYCLEYLVSEKSSAKMDQSADKIYSEYPIYVSVRRAIEATYGLGLPNDASEVFSSSLSEIEEGKQLKIVL